MIVDGPWPNKSPLVPCSARAIGSGIGCEDTFGRFKVLGDLSILIVSLEISLFIVILYWLFVRMPS